MHNLTSLSFATCLLLITLSKGVSAQTKVDCSKATTQTEINICAQNQFSTADNELNILYKKVLGKLDAQQKLVLVQSQRDWVKFRDDYSKIYKALYEGGTMGAGAVLDSKTQSTHARIAELRDLIKQL